MAEHPYRFVNRRKFIQYLAMIGIGGRSLVQTGDARAAVYAARDAAGGESAWPEMTVSFGPLHAAIDTRSVWSAIASRTVSWRHRGRAICPRRCRCVR